MLKLWENPMLSVEDRLEAAGGEIERLRGLLDYAEGMFDQLRAENEKWRKAGAELDGKCTEWAGRCQILEEENTRLKAELAVAQEELHFQACLTRDLLPYQERAIKSEQQLAAALAALEAKDAALSGVCDSDEECEDSDGWVAAVISMEALHEAQEALAIKPDVSILCQHNDALIERCAAVCEEYQGSSETCAAAIRELKSQL